MRYCRTSIAMGVMVLAMAAPLPVVSDSGEGENQAEPEAANETMGERWSKTLESLQSYGADQRDEALAAGKKTLDAMDERIDKMEAWTSKHWDSLSEEARERRTAMLNSMREQRRKVAEWYGGMKHSSSEAWDNVKEGFIRSYDKLQSAYEDASGSFDEEEPAQDTEE